MKLLALGDARRVTLLARRIAAEDERAAHRLEGSALRLEVVELRVQIVEAEAERVRAFQPREVRRADVLIIAEQERVPGVVIADVGPPAVDLERGDAALKPVGSVGSGDFQDVQSEVRNDIEAFRTDPLARVANVCVQDEPGTEGVGPADAYNLNSTWGRPQLPAVQSRAADLTEDWRVNDVGWRNAVAAKERQLASGIVVDLGIYVGAVELAYASRREVVCDAGQIRRRQALEDLDRRDVDTVRGNRVVREGRTQRRVGVRQRIVDGDPCAGEVHVACRVWTQAGRRDRGRVACRVPLCRALKIGEEEQFVLAVENLRHVDRAAEGIAELREDILRDLRLVCGLKVAARQEGAVGVVAPADAVELVSSRLDGDVDRRPARESLLSVEGVGYDIHLLDGLSRRDVNGVGRQPGVDDA